MVQSDHVTWILASDWSRLSNTEGDSLLTRNWECWDILPVFTNPTPMSKTLYSANTVGFMSWDWKRQEAVGDREHYVRVIIWQLLSQ